MDLRNNQITVDEVLKNPAVMAVLRKRYPMALGHPLLRMARPMTIAQVTAMARNYLPPGQIQKLLQELKAL